MEPTRIEREILVERPLEEVFAFFCDPANLAALTPPRMRMRTLGMSDPTPRQGTLLRHSLRVRGIPLRWTSRIVLWEPPRRFADEQVAGPYRSWHHLHEFEARGAATLVRDQVRYTVPGGALVDRLFVRRDVERIFDYRAARLPELLAGPSAGSGP